MTDEFQLVREVVAGQARPESVLPELIEPGNRRLVRALVSLARSGPARPGESDLAVLTRHAIRREQEKHAGVSPTLAVPKAPPWPGPDLWERFGVDVLNETATHLRVRARPWRPAWLCRHTDPPPDQAGFAEEPRRDYGEPLAGDPFLGSFPEWRNYRCAGQREAIRGVLNAPDGATLVANLPTGSGKSLAAYVPSLLDPQGLTVVVVPTTALALDQERILLPHVGHQVAYHWGTDSATEARNRAIRERVRTGTQRILFASPEGILKSLAGLLYAAAGQGSLRLIALDEAHIVDQWGDDFRPEFQELAGLRRDLLRHCPRAPFKTLLLTGTLTEPCLDTLETLFGKPGPFAVLSAVQLRPEPSYWVALCPDDEVRRARVLEAIRHLPRPLVLYVSKVPDANDWVGRLGGAGFLRVAVVTGQTDAPSRGEVIRAWQDDDLDLVVATSAFGLGMDKADVRAVIHACLPEQIDRFYQEVGRGGRDGKSCVSLLLHTPEDAVTARRLNRKSLITTDAENENKGFERWKAMFFQRTELEDGRCRVRIDTVPEYGFGRFENSGHNVAWNVHTLVLLARARIIDLDAQPPPRREHAESDNGAFDEELFRREFERHRNERVVRIIDEEGHLDLEGTWRGAVERARGRSLQTSARALELMLEATEGERCLADIFAEAYGVPPRTGDEPRPEILVSRSCGGCAACRRLGRRPYPGGMPTPLPAWGRLPVNVSPEFARFFGESGHVVLFDERLGEAAHAERQRRERLLRLLVARGFRSVVAGAAELERLRPLFSTPPTTAVFFSEGWQPLYLPRAPTIVFRPEDDVLATLFSTRGREAAGDLPRIIWLPADTRDPEKPHCPLAQTVRGPSYRLEEFCTRIGI